MELWFGALNLGILYSLMAIGSLLTYKILNFADITVDGSFTTGAAVAAILITMGVDPSLSLIIAFFAGMITGIATGIVYTWLRISGLLAGILVMIGLYSINLHVMGKSNVPLLQFPTVFNYFDPYNPGLANEVWYFVCLSVFGAIAWTATVLFLKTDLGLTLRSTGNNPEMSKATGVNVDFIYILGLAISNGLVALAGGFVAQYQGFADIQMGIGTLMVGLASVIIGETVFKSKSLSIMVFSAIVGSILYRLIIAGALYAGMNPIDLKLLTSVFVLLTLFLSKVSNDRNQMQKFKKNFKWIAIGLVSILLISVSYFLYDSSPQKKSQSKVYKIAIVQFAENGLLDVTRLAFLEELKNLKYIDGENAKIVYRNAHGDIATVNQILDEIESGGYDIVLTISTPVTQAAIKKLTKTPIIFATVANPFIIGAGTSDRDHLPNVTGVYGWVEADSLLQLTKSFVPNLKNAGLLYDPGQSNSVFNYDMMKKAIANDGKVKLQAMTINSSSEVQQAAQTIAEKNIQAFILTPDNIVYSAFDAIAKVSLHKKIPTFLADVERLKDGAFGVYGHDYTASGIQAARMLRRILNGVNPKSIPFEKYNSIVKGINLKTAKLMNIPVKPEQYSDFNYIIKEDGTIIDKTLKHEFLSNKNTSKKVALFMFSESKPLMDSRDGFIAKVKELGLEKKYNLIIDEKNAQNDYAIGQSVANDIVRSKYDYIVTFSTIALQLCAKANTEIPHIFGTVTDPFVAGIAKTKADHQKNITGISTFQPIESTLKLMRKVFPNAKTIGMVWNPAEANSEACTERTRIFAKKFGFELVEANATNANEVHEAVKSLLGKKIDIFFTSGDVTVSLAVNSVAKLLADKNIPYFTNTFSDVESGAFMTVGADYQEVGAETLNILIRVLDGEKTENISIENFMPEKIYFNKALAEKMKIQVSDEVLKSVSKVRTNL